MNNRERQLAGLEYDGTDAELRSLQCRAQELVKAFNALPLDQDGKQAQLQEELFGRAGKRLRIYPPIHVDFGCNIYTGDDVFINQNCTFLDNNRIVIGERVMFGPDVRVYAGDHPIEGGERYVKTGQGAYIVSSSKPVTIGSDVWVGGGAILLPGITVGNNVVIGAGSVVTKDVPDNAVVVGNPAKIIRFLKGEAK